ncbi:spore germination protein [Paenibacillus sp. 481]|uniref:spore germination protein n=1 Tax=Paenibacillus sp. 481 TaxID=2835869 RepID=UPI001E64F782|nr:spore germination protein [Paenibacillus sp. 481]UHA73816.1 spore germination protein [Paenibacillus sp. 481]
MSILQQLHERFTHHSGFMCKQLKLQGNTISILFISQLTDDKLMDDEVLRYIQLATPFDGSKEITPESLLNHIPLKEAIHTGDIEDISLKLLQGWCFVYVSDGTAGTPDSTDSTDSTGLLLNTAASHGRALSKAEIESHVFGSQVAFVEDLTTNIALIYKLLPDMNLHIEQTELGPTTKTKVSLMYLHGKADECTVRLLKQRLSKLKAIDGIMDCLKLAQLLDDSTLTLFPTMLHTERPDSVSKNLLDGKIAFIVDGSPFAAICPISLFEFFQVATDIYQRWNLGLLLRMLRMCAMFASIFATSFYVAAITYHYHVLPSELLITLIHSHSKVPFPPVVEALLLETIVELLREAGVRLPTKVGQTMGIVGGIVIGQAAVEAGFVSNVLLMIVALGALASFTIPNFAMGNTLQVIRYPFIILAGMWGGIGIAVGLCFLTLHLVQQTSVGRPYLQTKQLILGKMEQESTTPFLSKAVNTQIGAYPNQRNKDFLE